MELLNLIKNTSMSRLKIVLLLSVLLQYSGVFAKPPVFSANSEAAKPHRIIRTCCSFGTDVKFFAIPGLKITDITSFDKIGKHHYLGNADEGNGIIYTRRGGFIDMGHLRDQIDWMSYIYLQMIENREKGYLMLELGYEGGEKTLNVNISPELTNPDIIHLAGKIAYDLSVWHEIATWFGASTIPFIPERYSSFSIEDAYSNLLGITIGIKAIESDLPYEEAVTNLIDKTLRDLDVVTQEFETHMAMEQVRNIWWTREKRLPSGKILLQRQLNVYSCLSPWLVPGWAKTNDVAFELKVPENTMNGNLLNNYYTLEFKLNRKFPFKKIFPDRKDRQITQNDFDSLLIQIASELTKKDSQFQ
jgi:hypothetical protein